MDAEGFDSWNRGSRAPLVAALWALCSDRALAEESADEAFARALARWSRVRDMDHPTAWLHTVALNVLRRAKRRGSMERRLLRRTGLPVVEDEVPEPSKEVWDAVRQLPARQRTAVALRYVADLSEDEVASVMGVTRGTVASTLYDARRALSARLAGFDVSEVPYG